MSTENEREIFRKLVESQDQGFTVPESRSKVAESHAISVEDVIQLERRGIAEKWPPLDMTVLTPEFDKPNA